MPITPIDYFHHAIERADHLLRLYDFVHDTRQRSIRSDWKARFNKLMHYPVSEQIVRVDGTESILILRESTGLSRQEFTHNYASELLRAAISASISGLDRYTHDLIISKSISILSKNENDIPRKFKEIKIPILTLKKSLEKLRNDPKSRPGNIIKKQLQDIMHRDATFQSVAGIENAAAILGINKDFWKNISSQMPDSPTPETIKEKLKKISTRRNQIVHEADLILQTRAKLIKPREISRSDTENSIKFIKEFVIAFEKVASII